MNNTGPNYKLIYLDMINLKYPDRRELCEPLLNKPVLSILDIIELNKKVCGISSKSTEKFNQKHRSYNAATISEILDYQEKNKLNNNQLALHYQLSRNTVAKWKKLFR